MIKVRNESFFSVSFSQLVLLKEKLSAEANYNMDENNQKKSLFFSIESLLNKSNPGSERINFDVPDGDLN